MNPRDLQLARVQDESLLLLVLLYGDETVLLREKERARIRVLQNHNLRGMLVIRRMNSDEGVDERMDKCIL